MLKNKQPYIVLYVIGLVGCSEPAEEVSVDLSQIPKVTSIKLGEAPVIAFPALRQQATLQEQPAGELFLGDNESRIRQVELQLAAARQALFKRLKSDLERTKFAEIRRLEREELRKLDAQKQARLDALFEALWKIFVEHANQQFPPLVKLTRLVGFPDPGPSAPLRPGIEKIEPKSEERAQLLRAKIDAIQASYYKEAAKVSADAYGDLDAWMQTIKARIVELQAKALEEARLEAESLSRVTERIRLSERVRKSEKLPKVPAVTGTANSPSFSAQMPKASPGEREGFDERAVELKTWAAGKGYKLVPKGQGRDATKEFMEWKSQMKAGALKN